VPSAGECRVRVSAECGQMLFRDCQELFSSERILVEERTESGVKFGELVFEIGASFKKGLDANCREFLIIGSGIGV